MRSVLLALVLAIATLNAGCLGCGSFDGQTNRVYQRETEMLILCDNGGFVALFSDYMVEGRYTYNSDGSFTAARGEDGLHAFDGTQQGDLLTTPALGETPWTQLPLDKTALDHSDNLCQDLEYRSWWAQ